MSALANILHVGDVVTVRVPMWRPSVRHECIDKLTIDEKDVVKPVRLLPGEPLRIAAFLDRENYTLCELKGFCHPPVLIKNDDLTPTSQP